MDEEKVEEEEARSFAKSIGAFFCLTSALNASGIERLFKQVGLNKINKDQKNEKNNASKKRGKSKVKLSKSKIKENNKNNNKCCKN